MKINLPENSFSPENIHAAYLKCRKGKRGAVNTRDFEVNLYNEINNLSESLISGAYRPSRSVCFYLKKPKLREVFAAHFRDRVVHRLVVDILEPHYEKRFIYDSYACRKGKGTHAAVERLKVFIRKGTKNGNNPFYYLQLDIKGFFMRIDKDILIRILKKRISDKNLIGLLEILVYHNPCDNYVFRGKAPGRGVLPPHKTLFNGEKGKGIPIGNLTSQFFANVYLNELDQYVKRNLGVKYYIRYVDDFILMSDCREELFEWKEKIVTYIRNKLSLELKEPCAEPLSVYRGVDFLGYFVKPGYTLVRRRVVNNMKRALSESLPQKKINKGIWNYTFFHSDTAYWKILQSRLNSYLAHFHKANAYNLIKVINNKLKPYSSQVLLRNGYIRLVPKKPDRFISFLSQKNFFQSVFNNRLLIIEVGKFYEIYGYGISALTRRIKFKICKRRRTLIYCIRKRFLKEAIKKAKDFRIQGVIIKQTDAPVEKIKVRSPVLEWQLNSDVQLHFNYK